MQRGLHTECSWKRGIQTKRQGLIRTWWENQVLSDIQEERSTADLSREGWSISLPMCKWFPSASYAMLVVMTNTEQGERHFVLGKLATSKHKLSQVWTSATMWEEDSHLWRDWAIRYKEKRRQTMSGKIATPKHISLAYTRTKRSKQEIRRRVIIRRCRS